MMFVSTVCFAAIGLALHARRLPPQNLMAIALLIFASAAVVEWSARVWQVPFTSLRLDDNNFWCLPIAWIGAVLVSRKVAQRCFRTQRGRDNYGLWILAMSVIMTTALWSLLEAIMSQFNALNIVGRLATSAVILLVIFPWLIEKRPRPTPAITST